MARLRFLRRCLRDAGGATALEYALLAALIAGVVIGAVGVTGGATTSLFTRVESTFTAEVTRPHGP